MKGRSKSGPSPRPSKRKNEMESSSPSESKSKRTSKKNESEFKVDKYCWLCHTEADDKICRTCHRAYHNSCIKKFSASFNEFDVCKECQLKTADGTERTSKLSNFGGLKKLLDVVTRRSFDKKREKNEIFLRWPEEGRDNLFKIRDFEILLDNINHCTPNTIAEFYSDVKFIYHNACIAYGVNSEQAKAAENLRRDFKKELLDLEACIECYYYMYCDENDCEDPFVRICEPSHDIIWAQLTGHPYWPAKCLKVVKGMAHVKFFGEHEQANIPISKCLSLSERHPKDKNSKSNSLTNSGPKSQRYKTAISELLEYIQIYRRKHKNFPFSPQKTPYKPKEPTPKDKAPSAEENCNRTQMEMKLEGNVNEDSEMYIIDATTIVDSEADNLTFENDVTNDVPAPNGLFHGHSIRDMRSSETEGQYPTLAQINPSIDPSSSPCEGSETEGQYSTFAQLNARLHPSLPPDQDNPRRTQSAVTSINMTFSTDEINDNIENANPVTTVGSLPPAEAASDVISSPTTSDITYSRKSLQKYTFHHSVPTGTEIVPSSIVTNNASNDSLNQPSTSSNFPMCTANQDDEVSIIAVRNDSQDFNPNCVLPMLMAENPALRTLVQKTRYISDALIVQLYASFGKNYNVGKLSELYVELRKCKSELKKTSEENDNLRKENETHKLSVEQLTDSLDKSFDEQIELTSRIRSLDERVSSTIYNARSIIRGVRIDTARQAVEICKKHIAAILKANSDRVFKTNKQLKDADEIIKNLEEENRCLKQALEEAKVEKQRAEDKLKAAKLKISPDTISEYKRTHYCCVCERSAAIVCCLDTSYCSSECQERHAQEHKNSCKNKSSSQSFVQQRVISQQSVVMVSHSHSIITPGRSAINSPSSSEVSETDSTMGSPHHRKSHIHRVSASPLLPTPHYRSAASSAHSYSPKGKRRR